MTDKLPKVGDMTLGEYKAKMNSFFQSINKLAENIEKIQKPVKPTSEWQPIETAPKDGTVISVFHKLWKLPISVKWTKYGNNFKWVEQIYYYANYWHGDAFSHWMPLPKPPVDNNK
jgi:hypothetical protein